ncbi:phage protein [Streptococcus suis]|nr:phage protein [Streptococcus suis]
MKISNKLIVLREKKRGYFMESIENNPHSLTTKAGFVEEIRGALSIPYKYYLEQKSEIKALAKMHECEIILVDAEYTLTYPNGEEVSKIVPKESNLFEELMEAFKQF